QRRLERVRLDRVRLEAGERVADRQHSGVAAARRHDAQRPIRIDDEADAIVAGPAVLREARREIHIVTELAHAVELGAARSARIEQDHDLEVLILAEYPRDEP